MVIDVPATGSRASTDRRVVHAAVGRLRAEPLDRHALGAVAAGTTRPGRVRARAGAS